MRTAGVALSLWLLGAVGCQSMGGQPPASLRWIRPSDDNSHFVRDDSSERFVIWGVNYDHDVAGRLLEDYWHDEWNRIVSDFAEIRALGANVVRIHLQLGRFMKSPRLPNETQLDRLGRLVRLAESTGLYLDLTGLGCYHKRDVPSWYDELAEAGRWAVQERFWEVVAEVCRESPAIFCYDLMNEPILPGKKPATEWLAGEFGDKHFVQRITLDLAGRTRESVAGLWVEKMVAAIRSHDNRHMITVGVIPWALTFPGASPVFYSAAVARHLDFVSVHFYPRRGEVDAALRALQAYEIGKPLVVEEIFPLRCGIEEVCEFIDRSSVWVDGWISFYWGEGADTYESEGTAHANAVVARWLRRFAAKSVEMRTDGHRE